MGKGLDMKLPKVLIIAFIVLLICMQFVSSNNIQKINVKETELVKLQLTAVDEDGQADIYIQRAS